MKTILIVLLLSGGDAGGNAVTTQMFSSPGQCQLAANIINEQTRKAGWRTNTAFCVADLPS